MGDPEDWSWLCGNTTSFENFTWSADSIIKNLCVLDGLSSAFQIAFLILFSSTLVVLKCFSRYGRINTPYVIRYPGHFVRWLVSALLLISLLASIGEGVLSSAAFQDSSCQPNGLPHLYIAPTCSILCVIVSLIVNHHVEIWRQPKLSWLLFVYWLGGVVIETGQLSRLIDRDEVHVEIVRFDVVVGRLLALCLLAIIDMNVIRIKICRWCYNPKSNIFPKDLKSSSMRYYHEYSNSFSSGVFHWLHPVLQTGAGRPLEITDLGILPYKHSARGSYEELKKPYLEEKEESLYKGKKPSLWKACSQVSGWRLFWALVFRVMADSLGYVAPLVIGGITDYAYTIESEKVNSDPHFVTIQEYFANGYILLILAFLSLAVKGLLQANTIYTQQIEGIKLKAALQALVYEKSLRLSMFMTTSGAMTMGQISNHMAVDSVQGFWFSVICHFIICTPYNLVVTLVLLYLQMGYSALVGAAVMVLIFPFQLKVAKTVVIFQKKMLIHSDQRLKQSNELLQGMKLLKLYGWEELYEQAIKAVRRKELACLAKLVLCTAITIGFTSIAPILMTLVTISSTKLNQETVNTTSVPGSSLQNSSLMAFIIYPTLSGQPLTPGVTFSSLALFSQLSLPLFTVPITLTNAIGTMVSFRRLNAYFVATDIIEDEDSRHWDEPDIDDEEEHEYLDDKAFTIYPSLSGQPLQPGMAFASLALFNQLGLPLFALPLAITTTVNTMVSFTRLSTFFVATDVIEDEKSKNWEEPDIDEDDDDEYIDDKYTSNGHGYTLLYDDKHYQESNSKTSLLSTRANGGTYGATCTVKDGELTSSLIRNGVAMGGTKSPLPESIAIEIVDGTFTWDQDAMDPILSNINVQIPAGKLTMIVGQVGTGKSSLLSAMNGEMVTLSGHVQFNSERNSVAYAAQKAWLCNTTLKDNILFGQPMDEQRYKQVISACALGPDIEILPAGDLTEIGEKGINLSGGQKQRVSVARAMYANRDIIILDDPLSALDVHVGGHLFQEGIVGMLLKENQTVVLVTHQLQYLESADKILVLKDGCITTEGTVDEVTQADPDLYHSYRHALHKASESESAAEASDPESQSEAERDDLREQVRKRMLVRQMSEEKIDTPSDKGKLIEEEEMERGSVSYQVYWFYIRSVGYLTMAMLLLFSISQLALQTYNGFWLAAWSEAGLDNSTGNGSSTSTSYYIKGYVGLQSALVASNLIGLMFIAYAVYAASKNVHFAMLRNIIRAPIRFFDTTPVGRILNRMSSDTQLIDTRMCQTVYILIYGLFLCVSALLVNSIITPWFIALAIPMMIMYYYIQSYYLRSTRELQRLDSVSKSPVFAFFSETLTGLETIRAYKDQKRFFRTFLERLDNNLVPFMYIRITMAWLGVRLDFVGAFVVLLAGGSSLIGASLGNTSSSLVGLGLSLSISVAGFLNFLVRSASDLEIMMNAVERVKHYTAIENEDYEGMMPPRTWPQNGEIYIERVSARYAKELDPVLKQISVNIKAGEKVGICGRTGSGKSSLTLSLFRIIDMFEGRITIDDVDISSVPLTALRQKLSIIPQDPVLFTGSIRYNLDPEDHRSDDALWEAIEIAQLKDVVQALPKGLEYMVTEGGENFSMGQRQLFCLARAFLRKSRILIMDEATASIDMQTDKILQKVVATAFADRTVLTIAHRVTTILNCDTILVLSEGEIVEHDSPENLLAREDSIFADFVKSKK